MTDRDGIGLSDALDWIHQGLRHIRQVQFVLLVARPIDITVEATFTTREDIWPVPAGWLAERYSAIAENRDALESMRLTEAVGGAVEALTGGIDPQGVPIFGLSVGRGLVVIALPSAIGLVLLYLAWEAAYLATYARAAIERHGAVSALLSPWIGGRQSLTARLAVVLVVTGLSAWAVAEMMSAFTTLGWWVLVLTTAAAAGLGGWIFWSGNAIRRFAFARRT